MKTSLKPALNINSYFAVGLSILLPAATSASAQTKEEVVKAWQQQIASLDSLQLDYEATIKMTYDNEMFRANEPFTWKYKFALDGDKYAIHLQMPSLEKEIAEIAVSYNGEYYQALDCWGGKRVAGKWLKDKKSPSPYLGPHPITLQYKFVFVPDTPETIKILKDPATWEQTLTKISNVRSESRDGRRSVVVTMGMPPSKRTYEVLVDEKTLLPYKWSVLAWDGELVSELEVKTVTARGKEGALYQFPSEITGRGFRKDKPIEETVVKTNVDSLKINESVPAEVYNIVPADVKIVDEDEQERIFLEREKRQE